MAIYEVFSEAVVIRYKATVCSKSTFFWVVSNILTFIIPLLLICYTQDFWKKTDYYREQPRIAFKHKLLLVLETNVPGDILLWSTYEGFNQLISHKLRKVVPTIEHEEKDINCDGIKDELQLQMDVPLLKQEILSIKMILIFDFRLETYSNFRMECASFIHHTSSLPGSSFHVISDLHLNQKEPLVHSEEDERYNVPIIDDSKRDLATLQLEHILLNYAKRNVSTTLQNLHAVWKTGRSSNQNFKIKLVIIYPEQTILYKPSFWQQLKWALVQYISFFVIVSYAFYYIKRHLFRTQFLPTLVLSPVKRMP
ncbi:transmembrane protein 231-like [Uloborus diversus]|uniref:transmembrane protein 231-like n=1 Tax=Uloborus diversus TaxID=327109 RepID=UPI00240A4BB9|nr:transmembrane protein 231-like [Uloborus diversus]